VNLGGDTDTVAAVAGGLAGILYGAAGIPEAWRAVLARREWILGICERLSDALRKDPSH
jgi:ADP-ribosylglycohydrolase